MILLLMKTSMHRSSVESRKCVIVCNTDHVSRIPLAAYGTYAVHTCDGGTVAHAQ